MRTALTRAIELGLIHSNTPVEEVPTEIPGGGNNAPAPAAELVRETASEESWAELADDSEVEGLEKVEEVTPAATAAAPAPKPTEQPAAVAPKSPETPTATPQVTPPAVSPAPAAEEEAAYSERMRATQTALEERYKLSEQDAQLLMTEPEKVLPKLAAALVMDTVQVVLAQQAKMLPQAIMQTVSRQQQIQEGEDSFYKEWPDLKQHNDVVLRIGRAYRSMYPQATREQFIREVGAQAAIALRLPIDPATGKRVVAAPAATTRPFQPPRGGAVAPNPTGTKNEFEELAEEFLSDMS